LKLAAPRASATRAKRIAGRGQRIDKAETLKAIIHSGFRVQTSQSFTNPVHLANLRRFISRVKVIAMQQIWISKAGRPRFLSSKKAHDFQHSTAALNEDRGRWVSPAIS
jgi:hypothetical protein